MSIAQRKQLFMALIVVAVLLALALSFYTFEVVQNAMVTHHFSLVLPRGMGHSF